MTNLSWLRFWSKIEFCWTGLFRLCCGRRWWRLLRLNCWHRLCWLRRAVNNWCRRWLRSRISNRSRSRSNNRYICRNINIINSIISWFWCICWYRYNLTNRSITWWFVLCWCWDRRYVLCWCRYYNCSIVINRNCLGILLSSFNFITSMWCHICWGIFPFGIVITM